ncbi:PfkB family carbohydrate kinase [Pediococcus siamensis]|uniref:PfkB family carbohydrate kinase n=1 Tax=Pediococcus siamensis TaxID=381829 RepID=UPI00399FA175
MPQTLIVEDLSSVGAVSLSITLPVLTAFGMQPASFPSLVLSTHTGGFGQPATVPTAPSFESFREHWQKNKIQFNSVLVGYLGADPQIFAVLMKLLAENAAALVVIDPAFADSGHLYAGMTPAVGTAYLKLCRYAQVLLPNLTEAAFLSGEPIPQKNEDHQIEVILKKLIQKTGIQQVAVTGIVHGEQVGTAFLVHGKLHYSFAEKIPGNYVGTGDLFTSVVTGLLLKKTPFTKSLELANQWTSQAVAETANQQLRDPRMGIQIQSVFAKALKYRREQNA